MTTASTLTKTLADARACRACAGLFTHEPRPVLRAARSARLLIVGQAPGLAVHETGVPWNDPSGDGLRAWLDLDRAAFYDERRIAIVPMGLCFPGRDEKGADRAPVKACAALWHPRLRACLPKVQLTLLVGGYAQAFYLGAAARKTLTETVRHFRDYLPDYFALPHPSWRNTGWLKKNPWFEAEVVPELRARVAAVLAAD